MAIVGIIVAVVAGAVSYDQNKKAAKAQNKANQLQQQIADNQAASERRQQIRQARLLRGRVANAAAQTGGQGSSSEYSSMESSESQLGFNLSQSYATQALSGQITKQLGRASDYQTRASGYQALGQAGTSFAKGRT
jgi:hypothetical protein